MNGTGRRMILTVFSGAERLNNLEEKYDDSNLLTLLRETLCDLCERKLAEAERR